MKFLLQGFKEAELVFQHDMEPKVLTVETEGNVIETPVKAETTCTVVYNGQTFTGRTFCSMTDTFKPTTGCKKALSRAMKAAGLDKVDRALIWSELTVLF